MDNPLVLALIGTTFSFLGTVVGSGMVFFVKKDLNMVTHKAFLGFASGVMIAASIWSLLLPSMSMAEEQGTIKWLPAAIGFVVGGGFLYLLDKILPHMHVGADRPEGVRSSFRRTTMLVFAVTLHNIPEGMAVGLAFALAAKNNSSASLAGAIALAAGMALQNFPEGATISLPLKNEGCSRMKSFIYGALSGIVEPIAGVIGVILALTVIHIMPFMLAFA
ncbi:MAG: ZIP family metal transporter, partial [Oscillospiraceae bacterium]